MNLRVCVIAGPDKGREFPLGTGGRLVIGRGQDTDTKLSDPSISRMHCELLNSDKATLLKDCGSASGTFVNDEQVVERAVHLGDVVRLGDTELRIDPVVVPDDRTIAPRRAVAQRMQSQDLSHLVGRTIHRYAITKAMIRGKTGMIFRALDEEKNRTVAVKVLWPSAVTNRDETQRFVRAMKLMRPIKHPHIVRILNAGITENSILNETLCWYAMGFVDGENLRAVIKRVGTAGMLDWETALRVALHITQALDKAAECGFVHRNITPDNILLTKTDKTAKLGDLMLAKALEGTAGEQITQPGELLGDVPYMSPERTRGEPLDLRSDIYSLGATLYALLTGQPPFDGSNLATLIKQIQEDDPLPPKTMQLSINEGFENLVMKMLAKRPADRYQTPGELFNELARIGKFAGLDV